MNEIDFESEDGRKFKVPEDQVENFLMMAKSEGLNLKNRKEPTASEQESETTVSAMENEPKLAFKGSNGKRYEVPENQVEEFKQMAKNEGFAIETWKKREDLGVWGTYKKELEAKRGAEVSNFNAIVSTLFGKLISTEQERQENVEQRISTGEGNALELLNLAKGDGRVDEATIESIMQEADSGERSQGGFAINPKEEIVKQRLAEIYKPLWIKRLQKRNEAQQQIENAEELGVAGTIGKGILGGAETIGSFMTPVTLAAETSLNAMDRLAQMGKDKYTLDENGEPVLIEKGEDNEKTAVKALGGAVLEQEIWASKLLGTVSKTGWKILEKSIPGLKKAMGKAASGSAKYITEAYAKMQGSTAGRIAIGTGEALKYAEEKTHTGSLGKMIVKSRLVQFLDEVVGLNKNEGQSEELGKWISKITSTEDNAEMLLGLIGWHGIMVAGSTATGAYRTRQFRHGETKYGVGREELVKEFIGEEKAKKLGNEDLGKIYDLLDNKNMTPEKIEAFVERIKSDRAEAEARIEAGESMEEVMQAIGDKIKNSKPLEEAARELAEELKKGPKPEAKETPAGRAADFMERFWNGQIKTTTDYSLEELETKDESRIEGTNRTTGEEDTRPVIVLEKKDGTKELITGKKRVEAAREKGATGIDAIVIREEEGWTPEEARNLNTFENLHQGGLSVKEALKAVQRLGIKSNAELDLFGIDSQEAEIAVRIANEASDAVKGKIERGENVEQILETGMLDSLTIKACGDKRDGLQQIVLDKVVGKMSAEGAKRVIEVLKERDVDPTDAKAVDEAIAEGRNRASEGKPIADVEPVETPRGEMKTLGEVLGSKTDASAESVKPETKSETPIFDAASESGTNKGVELKDDGKGIKSCTRFPGVEIKVSNNAVIVKGMDSDVMTRPENLADAAALIKEIQKLRDAADPDGSKGVRILIDTEGETGWINEIAEVIKSEGELAYSQERFDMRSEVIRRLCESTGVKAHVDAKSWKWVLEQNGIQAWSNGSKGTYGCYFQGEVYLNPTAIRLGGPIHEYGHVAIEIARKVNPKLIEKGLELVKEDEWGRAKLEEIKRDSIYGRQEEAVQLEEVLTHLIETRGEKLLMEKGLGEKLKAWIVEVWKAIGNELGLENISEERIANMSLAEVADTLLADMMRGKESIALTEGGTRFGKRLSELSNPRQAFEGVDEKGKPKSESPGYWKEVTKTVKIKGEPTEITGSRDVWNSFVPDAKFTQPWPFAPFYHPEAIVMTTVYKRKYAWPKSYEAGKKGNLKAAIGFVRKCLDPEKVREIGREFKGAYLVPVVSHLPKFRNYIPYAYACELSRLTGLQVNPLVFQTSTAKSRNGDIRTHMFNPRDFGGKIVPGKCYVIVDDHNTVGFTAMAMKNFIEANGGVVCGYTCLTMDKRDSKLLRVADDHARELRERFPDIDLDEWLRKKNICSCVEALTGTFVERVLNDSNKYGQAFEKIVRAEDSEEPARVRGRFDGTGSWLQQGEKAVGRISRRLWKRHDVEEAIRAGFELKEDPVDKDYQLTEAQLKELYDETKRFEDEPNWDKHLEPGDKLEQGLLKLGRRVGVGEDKYVAVDEKSEELARTYAKGDSKAAEELYRRHGLEEYYKKHQPLFTEEEREDAESLAWKNILQNIRNGGLERASFGQILMRSAELAGIKIYREKRKNESVSLDRPLDENESGGETFKDNLQAKIDTRRQLFEMFEQFDPTTKEMLELKATGKTQEELAEKYGVQKSEIAVWLNAVREDLKTGREPASAGIAARLTARSAMTSQINDFQQGEPVLENHNREGSQKKDLPTVTERSRDYKLVAKIQTRGSSVHLEKNRKADLSQREITIIDRINQGKNYREIAEELLTSEGSVKTTVSAMIRKQKVSKSKIKGLSERENTIIEKVNEGKTNVEIAKDLKTTASAIASQINIMLKAGKIERIKLDNEERYKLTAREEEIARLREEGLTHAQIAERMGVSGSSIDNAIFRMRTLKGNLKTPSGRLVALLGRMAAGRDATIDPDVFVKNQGAWSLAEREIEQKPSGIAAAIERREALRPYTKPRSPADRAEPIAFDAAELIGFIREVAGTPGVPSVKASGAESSPSEKRIEMLARVFGMVDKSDVEHEKEKCKRIGLFAFEDPAWCAGRDPKEINANIKNSWTTLNKMMRSLFKKRVLTGEGGEHRATQVLASEIGNMLLETHVSGGHSSGVGAGRTMAEFIKREFTKPEHKPILSELEKLVAWWHGQDECPPEIKGDGGKLTGEAIGILMTQPESMAREAPNAYALVRNLLARHPDAAAAYEEFCRMRWNGKADDRLIADLEKTWDEETGKRIEALEDKSKKPSQSIWDDLVFALHDRFGPIFAIPKRAVKEMKARHDRLVAEGRMTRSEAQLREKSAEYEIVTLKSKLYDYQRSSEGEERLMVEGFADVINRAKEDGVDWRMVRRYAHLMRVIEIGGRATAFGIAPDRAARLLERLKETTGKEEYLKIEKTWKAFRAVYERFIMDDPRIMQMFDRRTQRMLRDNTHYVTMRHTMTQEEMEGYERRLEEYRKSNELEDPSLDVYMRLSQGGIGEADEREGFGLRPLKGSFEATKDPIAETIKRAIEIKRAAIRNQLVRDLRTVLIDADVKDVFENFKGKFRSDSRFGSLMYMEDDEVKRLVVPKIIESSFKASNQAPGRAAQWIGGAMRALKNTMTIWNPAFLNRAYMMDKASLESNVLGMNKDAIGIIAKAFSLRIPGTCIDTALPLYAVDNYLSRFTNFGQTWLGKILYNDHTANHYARQAQKIAQIVYEGKFGERLKEAERLRSIGKTSEAAEIEQNVMTAKEMMRRNVFQSKYNFDKVQKAVTPAEVLAAYGIGEVEWKKLKGIEKTWAAAKKGGSWLNRYGEEQEAVTKIIAWLYDEKMNPGGDADARARFVIEQGGTPNLGARGIWASWIENATGFFWNVRKQAMVRSWDAIKDHPTEWAAKALFFQMMPSFIKAFCVMGGIRTVAKQDLFDGDEKKMKESALEPVLQYYDWYGRAMQNVPSYVQKNYNVIPICTFDGGGTLALRLKWAPEEFAIQNLMHAAMNKLFVKVNEKNDANPTDPNADFTTAFKGIGEELLPWGGSENPAATLFKLIWNPLFGMNVRDDWRNRDIYTDDAIRARWTAPKYLAGEMARNVWNYSPLGNIVLGIGDEKETGGAPIPPTLGRVLYGCPILSRLPASVLGFYADPEKGALGGMIEKDKDIMAKVRLQSGEILQKLMSRGGNLEKIDEVMKEVAGEEIEPELKMQYYKLVVLGWRKWMKEKNTPTDMKLWKKANAIKDNATRMQAMDYVERAMREED